MIDATTKLRDHEGGEHAYTCKPFPFDQAFDLGLELAAIVGGPLGEAFKGLLMGSTLDDDTLDDQVIGNAVASIGELPERLMARGGSALLARILSTTTRVGKDEKGSVLHRLGDADDRDAAFAGGNLREAIDAARWVLEVNYGPFLAGMWEGLRPRLTELASSLQSSPPSQPTSEPQNQNLKPTEIVYSGSST